MANRPHKPTGYHYAVEWIAVNDGGAVMDITEMCDVPSVLLVADLYGKTNTEVAVAVIKHRIRRAEDLIRATRAALEPK